MFQLDPIFFSTFIFNWIHKIHGLFSDADDYEPPASSNNPKVADRWDGEDEDDDVKDDWDKDSEEEDSKGSEDSVKAVQRKKKKKLQDIIAEKEAAKVKELGKTTLQFIFALQFIFLP